jgi:hypothetical protein
MLSKTHLIVLSATFMVGPVAGSLAQGPETQREKLERIATADPAVADALQQRAAEREASTYTPEEFLENVRISWAQHRTDPGGRYILASEGSGHGTLGSAIGSGIAWIDKATGEERSLSYDIRGAHNEGKGLGFVMTLTRTNGEQDVQEYWFENLDPITIVLAETGEGENASRRIVRIAPEIDFKQPVRDLADHLPIQLESAVLFVDEEFAGRYSVSGEIVGVTSGRAGLRIELGLRPFRDAQAVGVCSGSVIAFEIDGHKCSLLNTKPVVAAPGKWNVYVSWRTSEVEAGVEGSHASSYAGVIIADALEAQP